MEFACSPHDQLEFVEVAKNIDEIRAIDIIHMDISKAFNWAQRVRLLWKVRLYGRANTNDNYSF